ncbi:MAG: hypothetical protein Q9204_007680 [Flavoplaca sp. TL-2023a]
MPEPVPKIPSEKRRAGSNVEEQSVSHDETPDAGRVSTAQSQPNEIAPDTTKLPSEVFSERRRRYSTIEPGSMSHLRASNSDNASSARYPPREITPDVQEPPLKSPSAEEQSSTDESAAESGQESVIYCGAAESHAGPKVSNTKTFFSRSVEAEKQVLTQREREIRQNLRDLLYEELRDVKAQQKRLR